MQFCSEDTHGWAESSPPMLDERSLCFDTDKIANFLINPDGTLRHINDAGRAMLFAGLVQTDGRHRLCLTRGVGRYGSVTSSPWSVGSTHLRQIDPTCSLAVAVRAVPSLPDILHVRVCEIRPRDPLDLALVADQFGISDSELPVLHGLAEAVCPKEISRSLGLSIHTIRSHLRSIYAKIGVHTAGEAQRQILHMYYQAKLVS